MYNNGISINPAIMMGKPCITGTRLTVELILEKLAAGETFEQMLESHPRLTIKGIQDALVFAADSLRSDVVYPIRKYLFITGKPTAVGTNVTADLILEYLATGKTFEQMIEEYPSLTRGAIKELLGLAVKGFSNMFKPKLSEELIEISR